METQKYFIFICCNITARQIHQRNLKTIIILLNFIKEIFQSKYLEVLASNLASFQGELRKCSGEKKSRWFHIPCPKKITMKKSRP